MIYDYIRELCAARGMSVRKLERELGLANATISKWKNQSPRISTILPVADYFGVTLDDLVWDEPEKGDWSVKGTQGAAGPLCLTPPAL